MPRPPRPSRPLSAVPDNPADDPHTQDEEPTPAAVKASAGRHPAGKAKGRPTLDDSDEFLKALWIGDSGTGKTSHMLSLANLGRVILIDPEPGGGAKARALRKLGINTANIEPYRNDLTFDGLYDLYLEIKGRLTDGEKIVGLAWDGFSESESILVADAVEKSFEKGQANNKPRAGDINTVFIEDYGVASFQLRKMLRRFCDLPMHVGINVLPKRDKDEDGAVRIGPACMPSVAKDLLGFTDMIVATQVLDFNGETEYSGRTRAIGKFEAKDRYAATPKLMIEPTFVRLLAYLREDLQSATDPLQEAGKARRQTD